MNLGVTDTACRLRPTVGLDWENDRMTHDPLCPTQTMCTCKDQECWDCRDVVLCQCDLIAKVRADERKQAE